MTELVCSLGNLKYYSGKYGYSAPIEIGSSGSTVLNFNTMDFSTDAGKIPIPKKYHSMEGYYSIFAPWDYLIFNPYKVKTREDEIIEQFEIVKRFTSILLETTKEIDSEIAKAVSDNFWDLL